MTVVAQQPRSEPASSRHREFANFLSVASSVLGGAILQVFLSPPAVVTADAAADPVAFGWCAELLACPAWQRSWQLSCVVAFCFVFLSIIGCATAAVASTSTYSLAAAILFFLASFMATAAAVLSIVFLSFSKAICIATSALLVGLLLTSVLLSWDGLMMGLDDVVLGPRLWKAAARGDLAAVRRYIRMGANPNWGGRVPDCLSTEQRMNVVFYAAEHHHYIGVTPLHIATDFGHFEVMKELLRHPEVKLSAADGQGTTVLHIAAANLDYQIVDFLRSRADLTDTSWEKDKYGWTPLLAAMEAGMPVIDEEFKYSRVASERWSDHLARVKSDCSKDTNRRHRKKTIKRLMYGPDKPDTLNAISPTHDLTALQLAIKRQWWSIAELLIEAGASVDVPAKSSTLGLACITPGKRNAQPGSMVEQLIKAGAAVDGQDDFGETPLHFCLSYLSTASEALAPWDSYQHIFESVGVLLRSGADTSLRNPAGLTPLIRAADEPQPLGPELTAMVLSFTPDVEATDKKGRTALDRAVCHGHLEVVELLLAAGANPNPARPAMATKPFTLFSPLQLAAKFKQVEVAKLLIEHGADVNIFSRQLPEETNLQTTAARLRIKGAQTHWLLRVPPLIDAIQSKRPEMVELLLENGADIVETGNSTFPSPLFFAATYSCGKIIRLLIAAGLDPDQPDTKGRTPADCARAVGNLDALAALQDVDHPDSDSEWSTISSDDGAGQSNVECSSQPGTPIAPAGLLHPPTSPTELHQSDSLPQHEAIDIPLESMTPMQEPSVPRISIFGRLAQAAARLALPLRRNRNSSMAPMSPQVSRQHEEPPRAASFSRSSSASSCASGPASPASSDGEKAMADKAMELATQAEEEDKKQNWEQALDLYWKALEYFDAETRPEKDIAVCEVTRKKYKECLGRAQHIASMLCGQLTAEVEALTSSINHEEPRRQQGQRRDGGGKAQRRRRTK